MGVDPGLSPRNSKGDGERIDFLSGGTGRHPKPDQLGLVPITHDRGEDILLKHLEGCWLTEESDDLDEQVLVREIKLGLPMVDRARGIKLGSV